MMKNMNETKAEIPILSIEQEPIELYKILKLINWVSSGGEAKFVISEGQVFVNQVVETRKRKKIYAGDIVEFDNNKIKIGKSKF
jgi:ribosome-associated protein